MQDAALNGYFGTTGGDVAETVIWEFVSGPNSAAGCLAIGTPQQNSSLATQPPALPVAYLLHHFGITLAANDAAQRYFGRIPAANAYERSLAQQLARLLPPQWQPVPLPDASPTSTIGKPNV